jgi:Patatin-like phospholipase
MSLLTRQAQIVKTIMLKSEEGPLPFVHVLTEEYKILRENTEWSETTDQDLFRKMDNEETPLSALCISGGGIRSATFALGAIQALAEKGILAGFDYLSTVSGGGYVGGWLTAWKQREHGLDKIISQLKPIAPDPPEGAPDPVQHLREYNNYLTPKLGLLSTDTWTLAATVGRNMMLNWLVLVPILLFVLMIPRLVLALARLGVTMQGSMVPDLLGTLVNVIPVVSGTLFAIAIFNTMRYLPGVGRKDHSEFDFLKYCLVPFIGAAVTFVAFDSWYNSNDPGFATNLPAFRDILLWMTVSSTAGWIAYLLVGGKAIWRRPQLIVGLSAAILLVGFSTACCAWLLTAKFYQEASWAVYVAVAAPLLILAFMLAVVLFVGLTSNILQDEDREWLSRAAAWMLLFIVSWVSLCVLVLLAPSWVLKSHSVWKKSLLAVAGGASGWISALGGLSSKTKVQKGGNAAQLSGGGMILDWAAKLAAPVFVAVFLTGLAIFTNWLLFMTGLLAATDAPWWIHGEVIENTHATSIFLLALVFLGFGFLMGHYININKFSLHGMYRDRLIRAYLGASGNRNDANKFTGFAETDNLQMSQLQPALKPFHVLNMALNLVHGRRLAWQQRKAESFTVSPLYTGHCTLGYRPSSKYGGTDGISLGTAITISGAAASPNMGYHSSPVIGFIMTLFNARLGAWMGNPGKAGVKTWQKSGPSSAIASLVKEAFGLTNDTNEYVYLSDGGHFENLAIYEMVRRGCRSIVVLDSGCDPEFKYDDLGNALRKIRIDQKIPIEFDESLKALHDKKTRFAMAVIRYSALDPKRKDGSLLYIKPIMLGNEPPDVSAYQGANPEFPHQSTSNQWFNESQTESYRMLGANSVTEICSGWDGAGGLDGLFEHIRIKNHLDPSTRQPALEFGRAASQHLA